jgi:endonuclease/exonuclease/phosphatase family metal-dependent hydrolase
MTWNLHGSADPDLDAAATAVGTFAPDVLALQEVQRRQAAGLAERLGMRFTWALKHRPYGPVRRSRAEGLAILTPHRLDAVAHAEISDGVTTWSWKRRIAQWGFVVRTDGAAIRIANAHLSPDEMAAARRREAATLTDLVGADDLASVGIPIVVAGDLNDDGDPTVIFVLPGIEHLVPSPTSPAAAPTRVLDHVLLPPDATAVSTTVPSGDGWAELSDHLPVIVRFGLDRLTSSSTPSIP